MINQLKNIKCYLLDMDGTFYLGGQLLPGALEFMSLIINTKKDYLFLTNNSSKHAGLYADKIRAMGFEVPENKILTSGEATTIYINEHFQDKQVFLAGTQALVDEFINAGIKLSQNKADLVVLGFDTSIDYDKIWAICDYVRDGLPYIATHPDFNCPTETGFMPDTGSFIALIEASTGRKPDVIIGKPHEHIVQAVINKTGYQMDEIAMIGDRLYTDIALGKTGIMTILTLSGESSLQDVETSAYKPDLIVQNLADLSRLLKEVSG